METRRALIGIIDSNNEVIRLATQEVMGRLVDRGDQFISKPTETLSEEEGEQVRVLVEIFNGRNIGDFLAKAGRGNCSKDS
jgi:hypothetical protein